jgi:hypothetical protein
MQNKKQQIALISLSALILCFPIARLALYLTENYSHFQAFDGYPANGAFQLFNPIRRILAGQAAGKDFQFFHGIGVPYLHFPFFYLFGADFKASEEARYFVAPLCFVASTWIFFKSQIDRTIDALILASVGWIVIALGELEKEAGLFTPGNSLLSVRSFLPVIIAGLMAYRSRFRSQRVYFFALGILAAMAVLMGTESGSAAVVALFLAHLATVHDFKAGKKKLADIATALGAGIGSLFAALLVISKGSFASALSILHFNFVEVPKDQFWYFGVPPNRFLHEKTVFLEELGPFLILIAGLAGAFFCFRWIRKRYSADSVLANRVLSIFFLLLTGLASLVSYLGMTNATYLEVPYRAISFSVLAMGYSFVQLNEAKIKMFWHRSKLAILSLAVIGGVIAILEPIMLEAKTPAILVNEVHSHYGRYGLNESWSNYTKTMMAVLGDQRCDPSGKVLLWSTYSSFLEDSLGCFHPDADYIIHALGQARRDQYLEKLKSLKPEFVQTMRRDFFPYEDWLMFSTWPVYEQIFTNYRVVAKTAHSLVWKKLPESESPDVIIQERHEVPAHGNRVELPASLNLTDSDLIILELGYEIHNPWRKLPVVGLLPRFLLYSKNSANAYPASLNPHTQTMMIPIFLKPGITPELEARVVGLMPGVQIELTHASVRLGKVKKASPTRQILLDYSSQSMGVGP